MENRYKIILYSGNIYKEIELSTEMEKLVIGTGIECDVRIRKDYFFEPIELTMINVNGEWILQCADNLCLTSGSALKYMSRNLNHGDIYEVRYQESDISAFSLEFVIDFDGNRKYERIIDVSSKNNISIGRQPSNDIVINSDFIINDSIELIKRDTSYLLNINNATYGVYVNGNKVDNQFVINEGDFISISDYVFFYKNGKLWTEIRTDIIINSLSYYDKKINPQYPKFNRNSRVKAIISDEKIKVLDPPSKPKKPKNNIFMKLLPSMGMLIASGAMAVAGGKMVIMSIISGVMAIITCVISVIESNREYKKETKERIDKYEKYISDKKEEIEKFREEERKALEEIYISYEEEEKRFESFSSKLFERIPMDEDFLCVRLGSGNIVSNREIDYKKQEQLEVEDELQQLPEQLYEDYKYVKNAPIICDLKEINALGIVGEENHRFEMFKNIVIDIVARQYITDVKMVFVAEESNKDKIHWLRFLPYVYNDLIGVRNIVCDDESKNIIFEYLYKELTEREQNKKDTEGREKLVVFFYNEYGFKNHPISKFVDMAKELGVTFIFFGDTQADIPVGCGYIIDVDSDNKANLINCNNKNENIAFSYNKIPFNKAKEIIDLMSPVYTEEISLEGTLTKNITLFQLLNIMTVEDIDLKGRWEGSKVFDSMAAPLGVSKTGVVELDLHDKAHGPHGLVAGTTGSGKSEILQTYILAMSTLYHPYEVGFVIIDFKGGGMVNQFKQLPHLLGAITNIDGKEIERSLKSIKAELQKRQRLFAEADVNHIDKYIKKYKSGEVREALPHLIIIVDEFAELKAEQPEFMKELISAARIGRSLGVHLILATQKPSGQVNEQIWSNSRFKLCLKVQSQQDSNEVLKSPLAAEIKEPGRAYLQVGNNEIFELFQSAYSGASEKTDDANVKEFTIYNITDSGKRVPIYQQKKQKSGEETKTQLDAIVNYVAEYCEGINLQKLPDICLPSLSTTIDFEVDVNKSQEQGQYLVDIGIFDDPDNQYQGTYSIDLGSNNLMIIGSSQTGKTNMLQNIIRSISTKYSPSEANIYILDFASMVLKNFERLNHVGGVVCASDDEKLKNLFKMLYTEIEERKEKLVSVGVSSFTAYKEAGGTDLPLIVLMIDNLTALKELYLQDDDKLLNLCREGLTVGISVIIANAQTSGIGYKYLSNFSSRIALFCNDVSEYNSLFSHCRERIDNIPGRCIVEVDKKHHDCQSYLAFRGEKEIDRVKEIKEYISTTNEANAGNIARKIPLIPATLTMSYVEEEFSNYMQQRFSVVNGLDYATVEPKAINFATLGMLSIIGREKSGKHNWLRYSIDMIKRNYNDKISLYVVDGIGKKLAPLKEYGNTVSYSIIATEAVTYIKEIESKLAERYNAMVSGDENVLDETELIMLVLDNQDAMTAISSDITALNAYKNIIGRYKNMNGCIITFVDNATISYTAPEMMKNVKDQRNMMYFDDIANMKVFDAPLALVRNFKKPIELGDGYYIKDNECVKLKTPIWNGRRG